MTEEDDSWVPDAALDVIQYGVMNDPVTAADGHTYDRASIEEWIKWCQDEGRSVLSPLTGLDLKSTELKTNHNAKKLVEEVKQRQREKEAEKERKRRALQAGGTAAGLTIQGGGGGAVSSGEKTRSHAHSVQDLAKVFEAIDPLRDLFANLSWQPPRIVVLGNEKSGKSSTLERLAMLPVFPKDTKICTRMAIELRLRRQPATTPLIQTIDISGPSERLIRESRIPMDSSGLYVSTEMTRVINDESSLEHKSEFSVKHMLRVIINSPHVCNLDLVDTPGLLGSSHKPDSMRIVREIVNHQIARSPHALFLVVLPGNQNMCDSLALNIIRENDLQSKTMAIISRADVCDRDMFGNKTRYQHLIPMLQELETLHHFKYGGVIVSNRDEEEQSIHHYQRLHQLAENETKFFSANEPVFKQLGADNRLSMKAVVSRISSMFHEYVRETWVPLTLMALAEETQALSEEDVELGLPRAHDEASITGGQLNLLKEAVSEALQNRLRNGVGEFSRAWVGLFRDLHGAIIKELTTTLPGGRWTTVNYRGKILNLRARINALLSDQVRTAPALIGKEVRKWLEADDSPVRLGRFPSLLVAVQKHAVALPLENEKAQFTKDLNECVRTLIGHSSSPVLRPMYFPGNDSVELELTYDPRQVASAILEHMLMSKTSEIIFCTLDKLNLVAMEKDIQWREACAVRRAELLRTLDLIEKGRQHIKTTLSLTDMVPIEELQWLPQGNGPDRVKLRADAEQLAMSIKQRKDSQSRANCDLRQFKRDMASLMRSPQPSPRSPTSAQAPPRSVPQSPTPNTSSLEDHIIAFKRHIDADHTELERLYRDLLELKRRVEATGTA